MEQQPLFVAKQRGDTCTFRGQVLDPKTYQTMLVTAHVYPNETVAKVAARRMWVERKTQEVAA